MFATTVKLTAAALTLLSSAVLAQPQINLPLQTVQQCQYLSVTWTSATGPTEIKVLPPSDVNAAPIETIFKTEDGSKDTNVVWRVDISPQKYGSVTLAIYDSSGQPNYSQVLNIREGDSSCVSSSSGAAAAGGATTSPSAATSTVNSAAAVPAVTGPSAAAPASASSAVASVSSAISSAVASISKASSSAVSSVSSSRASASSASSSSASSSSSTSSVSSAATTIAVPALAMVLVAALVI